MITLQKKPDGALPYFMKKVLERLRGYETLTCEEARETLLGITAGMVNDSQVAAFVTAFIMRPATIDELSGFCAALKEQAVPVNLPAENAIDIVGTGGDGKHTFNISTISSLVVAGCGYKVIKHGNHGATSVSGSSDVLAYLGYHFTAEEQVLNRQLEKAGICFLHAPLFHPVMKRVAPVRSNLGLRTFFNQLGPLTNPAQPGFLLLGANTQEAARTFHYFLQETATRYRVVHTLDGHDELSLTGPARIYSATGDCICSPGELGFAAIQPASLYAGKDVKSAAAICLAVLENKAAPACQQVVIANSAMAIQCLDEQKTWEDCIAEASEGLLSGKAFNAFKQLLQIS